jgi:hypothetical protein
MFALCLHYVCSLPYRGTACKTHQQRNRNDFPTQGIVQEHATPQTNYRGPGEIVSGSIQPGLGRLGLLDGEGSGSVALPAEQARQATRALHQLWPQCWLVALRAWCIPDPWRVTSTDFTLGVEAQPPLGGSNPQTANGGWPTTLIRVD